LDRQQQELRRRDKEVAVANKEMANERFATLSGFALELRKNLGQIEWEILSAEVDLQRLRAVAEAEKEMETAEAEKMAQAESEQADGEAARQAAREAELLKVPEIPEEIIEAQLLADPAYKESFNSLEYHKRQLALKTKRFGEGHREIRESENEIVRLNTEREQYREQQIPEIRNDLEERLRSQRIEAAARQEDQQQQTAEQRATGMDLVAYAEAGLAKKITLKERVQKELEARELEVRDLGSLWVDRELQAEKVQGLKGRVLKLDGVRYAREVELEYEERHPPIRIRQEAQVPKSPDQGKRIKMATAAGLGGFGLVAGCILLLEYSARRLTSVSEVHADLNLQVMATIPLMPRWLNSQDNSASSEKSAYWHSVLTESVDAARALLLRQGRLNSTQVVMIASAVGGEGKTTLSCHIATSLARAGRRVLLIDGDLRRPGIHHVYNVGNTPGLSELLSDTAELADAIHESEPHGLSVMSAGQVSSQVLRSLAQDRLGQLMDILRERFDFIIIDSSPLLLVTDGLLMSQTVDGVLMSIRRDVSRVAKVAAAAQRLSMLGINVLGAVAIGLDDGPAASRYSPNSYGYGYNVGPYGPNEIASNN
jgi:capsular exopolysaccharide synthesis family protein